DSICVARRAVLRAGCGWQSDAQARQEPGRSAHIPDPASRLPRDSSAASPADSRPAGSAPDHPAAARRIDRMPSYWFQPHSVTFDVGGRPMTIVTGRLAKQATGAAVVTYCGTMVLVTCVTAKAREGVHFLPLTVDLVEKTSAAGKIPGGFFKREGRLSDREVLVSRFIDRSVRPLFADGWRDETQITATVLSADRENPPDLPAFVGASAALHLSEAPFLGPIGAVRIGRVD